MTANARPRASTSAVGRGRRSSWLRGVLALWCLAMPGTTSWAEDPLPAPPIPVPLGARPWEDRATAERWFDEACAFVAESGGAKFLQRPVLRVVTRRELELVLRDEVRSTARTPEALAAALRGTREQSLARAIHRVAATRTICFAPANQTRPVQWPEGAPVPPPRAGFVLSLAASWNEERSGSSPVRADDFEESSTSAAVRAGYAAWVAEQAADRWGERIGWDEFLQQWWWWHATTSSSVSGVSRDDRDDDPMLVGIGFFREVSARAGVEGVRAALRKPPRRLRDLTLPAEWLRPTAATPPYLDLWQVVDALSAVGPRSNVRRSRPQVNPAYGGARGAALPDPQPVDIVRETRSDDGGELCRVEVLQFRDAAACDAYATVEVARAARPEPPGALWSLFGMPQPQFRDGAGSDRRCRGHTVRRSWLRRLGAEGWEESGVVVVGPLLARFVRRAEAGAPAGTDTILSALDAGLRAIQRGGSVERHAAVSPTAAPRARRESGDTGDVITSVVVRTHDGAPAVGAAVEARAVAGTGREIGHERVAWTDGTGRAEMTFPSADRRLRVRVTPPIDADRLAPVEADVGAGAATALTFEPGWVATGVVNVRRGSRGDATVVTLLPDGERREVDADFDGSFRIEQLPDVPVRIQARLRGDWDGKWSSGSSPWTTVRSPDPDVVLDVEPDDGWDWARLSVAGPDGTPASSALIVPLPFNDRSGSGDPRTPWELGGLVRFGSSERRFLVIGATAGGRRLSPQEVEVPARSVEAAVRLDLALSVAGHVRDEDGRPVAGAKVAGGLRGIHWRVDDAITDAHGAFRLSGFRPGACWVAVVETPPAYEPEDGCPATAGVSDVVLRVRRRADLVVSVLDPSGREVAGASVELVRRDPEDFDGGDWVLRASVTDVSGLATLVGAGPELSAALRVVPPAGSPLARYQSWPVHPTSPFEVRLDPGFALTGRVVGPVERVRRRRVRLSTHRGDAPRSPMDAYAEVRDDGSFSFPHLPRVPVLATIEEVSDHGRGGFARPVVAVLVSPTDPEVVMRVPTRVPVVVEVAGVRAGRALYLTPVGPDPDREELTADEHGRFEWIEAADVPHELWIPPTPEDPRVAYLPDYVPGPTPPTLTLTAPGVARFRRPAFEGGQVDGATVEDAWVVGPLGMAFAARLVAEGRFEVDGLPPGTFPAVVRVRTGKGWVRCTGPATVGAPEVELPRP